MRRGAAALGVILCAAAVSRQGVSRAMLQPALPAGVVPTPREIAQAHAWLSEWLSPRPKAGDVPGLLVHANHGVVQPDARGTGPLRIAGQVYTRGLYCHANSSVEVRLPEPGASLSARAGVDSNDQTAGGRGSVVFRVVVRLRARAGGAEEAKPVVGEQAAYTSPLLREGMPAERIAVGLGGATRFRLEVGDGGDGNACDQADWAEAKVTLVGGRELWLSDLPFLTGAAGRVPFSFVFGGKESEGLLATWERTDDTQALDDLRTQHTIRWRDPASGLQVRCAAIEYHDSPVVEWTVYFRNTGERDTPILEAVRGLDLQLQRGVESEYVLHCLKGDSCTPDSYEPFDVNLEPGSAHAFASVGGRPTNGQFPYYNLQRPGGGIAFAVGWPGQWRTDFTRDGERGLRVCAGQERLRTVLRPGEEVRTPLMALLTWEGTDVVRAQNLWRRWMVAHNMPRPHGQPPKPILAYCDGAFFPGLKCTEADESRAMGVLQREGIKLDYWWMDAGWYPCTDWAQGVGTWEPDPERFPRGIRAVSDAARKQGAGLILWFEPERVMPGTWLATQHPEWLLGDPGGTRLLNLGNPAARQWLTDHVDRLIREQGIGLYRQDFNMDPLGYWRANDGPDREGMTENLHVQGYLWYWDELRRRHPDMLIDSCASGGRRNDLETLRRAVPLLRSDYQSFSGDSGFAPGNQGHTYGLSQWVPYYGQGVYYSPDHFVYAARSYLCPAFGIAADCRRPDVDWDLYRRMVAQWREVADCFLGDYYPLTAYGRSEQDWMGWQFDLPGEGRGMVQAFRRTASSFVEAAFCLRGLDPEATYRVRDLDREATTAMTGRQLMEQGLPVRIEGRPGAVIIAYKCTRRPENEAEVGAVER